MATTKSSSNETQIRTLIEDWAKSVRAQDTYGAIKNHAKDMVMFDVPLPLQSKGIDAYKGTWELFFSSNEGGDGSFNIEGLEITAGDTVAFAHSLLRIGGSKEPVCRLTIGFRKLRGKWLISHEHHSYPDEE